MKRNSYEITETGLVTKNGWTPELWEAAGHEIARYQKGLMWLVGDWLNAGENEGYVERGRMADACNRFGIAYDTAAQASRVSAAFDCCSRLQHLSFNHHLTVANHPQAAELLEWAEATNATVKQLREEKKRRAIAEKREKKKVASVEAYEADRPSFDIMCGDVMDGLQSVIDNGYARLIFTDPPYNIGVDYGDGASADRLTDSRYIKWVRQWFGLCRDALSDDGSLWVMIGDEYAAEYGVELKAAGFTIRSWVKWYESFGVNCSNKFNRTSRHIFYAVKNEKDFVFNTDAVTRPSDRQTKYGDKRAAEGGKIWDDVWQIPRLTGTCAERVPDFPTQLPLALVEPIVLCASMPGDLVVDPFNGSGTTGVASIRNGRKYVGIEKSEKFADMAIKRLLAT